MARGGATSPAAGDDLLAGVEVDGVGAVGVQVAVDRVLPAGEGEPGDRRGDADVDTEHARLGAVAVGAGGGPGTGEDRPGVAVARAVEELERFIERADLDNRQQRAEELI